MSEAIVIEAIKTAGILLLGIFVALINRNVKLYHKAVNGHMKELLKLKKAEGKEEQRVETENKA